MDITLTELERRRLDLFNQGYSIQEIAKMENTTFSGIQTTIWRANAKLNGTYQAPPRKGNCSPKKSNGFEFKEHHMEKVDFIKKYYNDRYNLNLDDNAIFEMGLKALFSETYDEMAKHEREKVEEAERQAERERIAREKAEADRIAREKAEAEKLAREAEEAEKLKNAKAEREANAKKFAESFKTDKRKRGYKYFTGYESTTADIKKMYKKLSIFLHPDNLETGDNDSFIEMRKEYEKLMNA